MKKLLAILCLLLFTININAQQNTNQVLSPKGIFDEVYDNYGNKFSLDEIRINKPDSNGLQKTALLCSAGYFDLYFETNCGMDGSSPVEVDRRNVLCQLFNDLSQFIVPANPSTKVNIWVRDISNIISSPSTSGVLGLASGFYTVPSGAPTFNGIADNEIWKTINSGTNSYTNVSSPLTSLGGPNASFYHGMMAFNFSNPSINWHTNLTQTTFAGLYDMYSVALHETTHALGFSSLIGITGDSKFGATYQYYSRYDLFLKTSTNLPLLTNSGSCSLYGFGFNATLNPNVMTPSPFNCSSHIQFAGSVNQAVYSPSVFAPPSSLSHFEDICHTPGPYPNNEYYVMSDANGSGSVYMKRYLKPEERKVLCDIGYQVNTSFGNVSNLNFFNYGGTICPGLQVAGINDGIDINGFFQNTVTVGNTITLSFVDILQNDFNAASFECLQDVYGNGTLSTTSGTSFTFTATSSGIALLRYIPVSSSGNRGNITYIFIYVQSGNCNVSSCDLVNNGGYESGINCGALNAFPANCPGQLPEIDCWTALSGTPDFFVRGCIDPICGGSGVTIPTSYCSPTADTWNSGTTTNDNIVGFGTYNYSPTTLNEGIQGSLSTPLQPSVSYTLKFVVRVANNTIYNNLPGALEFAGSTNLLAPIGYFYNSPPASLTSLSQIIVPNNNAWNSFSIPISNPTASPINYLSIINAGYLNGNPTNSKVYMLIDDISIVETNQLGIFSLPTTLCINQVLPDLSLFASPPGGSFTGNGVIFNAGIYSFDPSVAGAGTHTITYTYTSNTGCVYDIFANITVVNANFNLSATAVPATICLGESSTLTASGASTYTWNPGNVSGNTYVVNPTSTMTYTVTGTSASGCVGTTTVTVNVNPSPTVTANATSTNICSGDPVTLTGGGATSYTWDNGVTDGVAFNPTVTTTYTVTGTSNGCSNTAMITITVNPSPTVVANATNTTICSGDPVTLSGSGATSYTWDNGVIDGVPFNPTVTTTYTVTGTSNGCSNTAMITITVNPSPTVTANATSTSICSGDPVTLTGSGATSYTWDNGVTDGIAFNPTTTTTYTVTGTTGSCSNTATVTVNVVNCNIDCSLPTTITIPATGGTSTAYPIPNGSVVDVLGTFTIDNPSIYTNVKFRMAAGTQIKILSGNTLTLSTCHLFSCTQLWGGIEVPTGTDLVVMDYSIIEDAKTAITWRDGGVVKIHNSILNKNVTGLALYNANITNGIDIVNSIFTCRDLPPIIYTINFSPWIFNIVKTILYNDNTAFAPYATILGSSNRSLYGVISFGVETTIGTAAGNYNYNLFDYQSYGIYVDKATFTVIGNRFANCFGDNSGPKPTGVGVYAITKDPNTITIGGNMFNKRNIFRNCYRGANIEGFQGINFINNRVLNTQTTQNFAGSGNFIGHYGLAIFFNYAGANLVSNYYLNKNKINNCETGIYINRNWGIIQTNALQIQNNNINVTGTGTYCNRGIWMQDVAGNTPVSTPPNAVSVRTNTIKNCEINAMLFDNVKRSLLVQNNNELSVKLFNTPPLPTQSRQVVRLNACDYGIVRDNANIKTTNNTTIPSGSQSNFITGIWVSQSPNSTVTCNTARFVDVSLLFDQPSPNSIVTNNVMNKAQIGLVLANGGVIGTQGSPTSPSGNRWGANNSSGISFTHTYTFNTFNANTNSILYCKPNPLVPCSASGLKTFPCANQTFNLGFEYSTLSGGLLNASGFSLACPVVLLNQANFKISSVINAINGNNASSNFAQNIRFRQKRFSFNTTKEDTTGTLMANTTINTFYNQTQPLNIGLLTTTEDLINQQQYSSAKVNNLAATTTNTVEINYQLVYDKILEQLTDTGYVYTASDIAQLESIAQLCMQENGEAVTMARALLAAIKKEGVSYNNDCIEMPFDNGSGNRIMQPESAGNNIVVNQINLYPNPNNGSFTIEHNKSKEVLTLTIMSIVGKIVYSETLNIKASTTQIATEKLENGIYLISITNHNGNTIYKSKINIIK